jgi:hypothetical protein
MPESDDPDTRELRQDQSERKTSERELERQAEEPAEQHQHKRRGDKAAYLEEKLAERERSEREAD